MHPLEPPSWRQFASWQVDFLKNDGCVDPDCVALSNLIIGSIVGKIRSDMLTKMDVDGLGISFQDLEQVDTLQFHAILFFPPFEAASIRR